MANNSAVGVTAQKRWTEKQARAVLEAWRRSGQSVAAFADAIGVVPQRLYWWKSRLGAGSTAPTFVPVVEKQSRSFAGAVTIPCPSPRSSATLVVVLTDGVRIEVHEVDASTAAWVAAVLAEGTRR
jgi:hypothetical protein